MGSKDLKPVENAREQRAIEATFSELQMGQYPIFCITKKKPTDNRMIYREKVWIDGAEVIKEWIIQIAPYYGWPGELEAEVWRSIHHIVELRARAGLLTNPVQTTLEEIREHMSSKSRGGRQWKAIVRALHCLASTNLETNYWYDKAQNDFDSAQFALIADLTLSQRRLPNGKEIIGKVYVGFGPKLFKNLQNRYIRPLDKGYMDTCLDRWLAKRLYELLGPKFYGLRKKKEPYRTRYSRLCGLLGTNRQRYLSDAKRILGRAHEELQSTGFLAQVGWYPLATGEKNDWVLDYWPGPRAKAEWKKDFWKQVPQLREALYIEEPTLSASDPIFVEEPPVLDESNILAEVLTERVPEMPRQLPLLIDEPLTVQASAVPVETSSSMPAERSKPASRPQSKPAAEAVLQAAEGLDPYAQQAIEAFERATGKHRRLARLSEAERRRLAEWEAAGITAQDIEQGTRTALAEQTRRAREDGRQGREIVSLAYVRGPVLDVANKRLRLEKLRQEAVHKVRASQSQALKETEARLKRELQNRLQPTVYRDLFEPLLVAHQEQDYVILLDLEGDSSPYVPWKGLLEELLGLPAVFGGIVDWAKKLR